VATLPLEALALLAAIQLWIGVGAGMGTEAAGAAGADVIDISSCAVIGGANGDGVGAGSGLKGVWQSGM